MKKKNHLTTRQRHQIVALLQTGTRRKAIARIVGTSESTISRELKRNSSKRGYSAHMAQEFAEERKERFRRSRKFTPEMEQYLRHRLKHRKRPVGGKKVFIPDKRSIDERPEIINNRERFGDWEIDTIIGKEFVSLMLPYRGAVLSITSDNGSEFYEHKLIARMLSAEYFFAHPYSSWERGAK